MRSPRSGVAKSLVAVVVVVLVVVAGAYLFLSRSSGTTVTTSSNGGGGQPTVSLQATINQMVQDINARNVDAVTGYYNQASVVVWSGHTGGLSGLYDGATNVRLIYATTVGKTTQINVNISKYAEDVFSPTHINATYVLKMNAQSSIAGNLSAIVNVSQEWNWGSSGWQIARENWAYTYFDSSLIDAGLGSATTFPQWGYMLKGGNPNLVSEKSFEWHSAPLLAAAVYAFMAGVGAIMLVRYRAATKPARSPQADSRASKEEPARRD